MSPVQPAYVTVTSRVRMSKTLNVAHPLAGHALITGSCSREHYYMVEFRHRTVATVASETAVITARRRVFPVDEASSVTTTLIRLLLRSNYCLLSHNVLFIRNYGATPCPLFVPTSPQLGLRLRPPHLCQHHHHRRCT